jgi:hypothetical protein
VNSDGQPAEGAAIVGSDYGGVRKERSFTIRSWSITVPGRWTTLYFALKPGSANGGAVDYPALLAGQVQPGATDGRYQLFRIGDAVSARNTHAAIYDALRLVKDL